MARFGSFGLVLARFRSPFYSFWFALGSFGSFLLVLGILLARFGSF